MCSELYVGMNVAYLVRSEVLESLYRWVTGYVPETACCVVAGLGTGETGPTTVTAEGRRRQDIRRIRRWLVNQHWVWWREVLVTPKERLEN